MSRYVHVAQSEPWAEGRPHGGQPQPLLQVPSFPAVGSFQHEGQQDYSRQYRGEAAMPMTMSRSARGRPYVGFKDSFSNCLKLTGTLLCCSMWLLLVSVAIKAAGSHHLRHDAPGAQQASGSPDVPASPEEKGAASMHAHHGLAIFGLHLPSLPRPHLRLPDWPDWPCFGGGGEPGAEDPYDCTVEQIEEVQSWDGKRRAWCCGKYKLGCYYERCHSTEAIVDWSPAQRRDCCRVEGIGCSIVWPYQTETTTTSATIRALPFDCQLDADGSWATWAPDKAEFCCSYSQRGCPTKTSTTVTITSSTTASTTTTPQPTIMVPFPACNPDDKGCTTLYPTPLPMPDTTIDPVQAAYALQAAQAAQAAAAGAAAGAQAQAAATGTQVQVAGAYEQAAAAYDTAAPAAAAAAYDTAAQGAGGAAAWGGDAAAGAITS